MKSKLIMGAVGIACLMTGVFFFQGKKPMKVDEQIANRRIHFMPYQEEDAATFDEGYEKWVIVFENIPVSDLQTCEMRRLMPKNTVEEREFVSVSNFVHSVHTKEGVVSPFSKGAAGIVISSKGFLPGEEVMIRVRQGTTNDYDYISFYPCPIVLRRTDGEVLCTAELASFDPALYKLNMTYDPSNKLVKTCSIVQGSQNSGSLAQEGPIEAFWNASAPDVPGGTSVLELTYENGEVYGMELPWGENLAAFLTAGN